MPLPIFSEHTVRSLATPASFFKGKKYFYDGMVGVVETDGDRYWAKVQGRRPYRTTIYQRDGSIHGECTCPYNFSGICKHAVAAMLKVINEGARWHKEPGLPPADMVRQMSKAELESFVIDLIDLKEGILDLLRSRYLGGNATSSTEDYLRQVEEVFKDENLSIYNNRDAYEDLQPVENLAEKLKRDGNYREAAKVFEALFEGVAGNLHKVEDSYGLFGEIAGYALEEMVGCLISGGITADHKHHYIHKFLSNYEHMRYQFFNQHYRDAILRLASRDDLKEVLAVLDKLIKEYAGYDDYEDAHARQPINAYRHAIAFKLDVLEELGDSDKFMRFASANSDNSDVCLKLALKLQKDGDHESAITTAEHCSEAFSGEDAERLNRFLAESYEKRGEPAKAIEKYSRMFIRLGSFEYYERLRGLAMGNGSWPQVFNAITAEVAGRYAGRDKTLCEIYLKEGMHEQAIMVAERSADLTVLEMVAEAVREPYPVEAYELYRRLVDAYLDENMGRPAYQQAVSFLARMREIGMSGEFASYLNDLSSRFSRRRALLDEMRILSA